MLLPGEERPLSLALKGAVLSARSGCVLAEAAALRHAILSTPPIVHLQGADAASVEAYATLDNVRKAMGFGNVHGRRRGE